MSQRNVRKKAKNSGTKSQRSNTSFKELG